MVGTPACAVLLCSLIYDFTTLHSWWNAFLFSISPCEQLRQEMCHNGLHGQQPSALDCESVALDRTAAAMMKLDLMAHSALRLT